MSIQHALEHNIFSRKKAATFLNNLAVAVKRGDEAEQPRRMLAEIKIREEQYYIGRRGWMYCIAVRSFAAAWNVVETKLMNGELVFIIILLV